MCVDDVISLFNNYKFEHHGILNTIGKDWRKYHKEYFSYVKEQTNFIDKTGNPNMSYGFIQRLYYLFNDIHSFPLCPICKLPNLTNHVTIDGYTDIGKYCGCCFRKSPEYKKRIFDKYGCYNVSCSPIIKQKKKETTLLHFGVDNPSKCKEICDKRSDTILKRYGTRNVNELPEIKDRIKKTTLELYGSDNVSKLESFKRLKIETCRKNFGSDYWSQTDCGKKHISECNKKSAKIRMQKCKLTNIQKYGREHFMQTDKYKQMFRDMIRTKVYEKYIRNSKYSEPLFDSDYYVQHCMEQLTWKCCKCGKQFNDRCCHDSRSVFNHVGRCPNCYPPKTKTTSVQELEIVNYITQFCNCDDIQCNCREVISPYELDIYLKDRNFAIEFNGLYWHSEIYRTFDYHKMKHDMCVQNGIRLFNIYEDDWYYKKDIIKSQINRILGVCDVINEFDKCEIIDKDVCIQFLNENSNYLDTTFDISYGCYKNGILICVMTFMNDHNIKHYAIKNYINTDNGFKILFSKFVSEFKPEQVQFEYYDDWFCCSKFLLDCDFYFSCLNEPRCLYYKNSKRYTLQEVLKNIENDANVSQEINILNCEYYRIYDIGSQKYIWRR